MRNAFASAGANVAAQKTDSRADKYLSFRLAKEDFAVDVSNIREMMGMQEIKPVTQAPPYIKGAIHLRGRVVPVLDLRVKFGYPETAYTHRTCILVLQIEGESRKLQIGAIVDGVSEVLVLSSSDIDASNAANAMPPQHVVGTAKIKGKVRNIVDTNRILSAQEMDEIEAVLQ